MQTVRNKTTSPDPLVGLIVLSSVINNSRSRAALDVGPTSLCRSPRAIIAHVRYVAAKQWRFMDAPNYFGPARRVHTDMIEQALRMRSTALAAFKIKISHTA